MSMRLRILDKSIFYVHMYSNLHFEVYKAYDKYRITVFEKNFLGSTKELDKYFVPIQDPRTITVQAVKKINDDFLPRMNMAELDFHLRELLKDLTNSILIKDSNSHKLVSEELNDFLINFHGSNFRDFDDEWQRTIKVDTATNFNMNWVSGYDINHEMNILRNPYNIFEITWKQEFSDYLKENKNDEYMYTGLIDQSKFAILIMTTINDRTISYSGSSWHLRSRPARFVPSSNFQLPTSNSSLPYQLTSKDA